MVVDLANLSRDLGHEVSVCVTRDRDDLAADLAQAIPRHVLHRRSRFDLRGAYRLVRLIRSSAPDILHVHGRSSFSLVAFLKTLRLIHGSVACLLHDHYGKILLDARVPWWFRHWARRYVDLYVGVSPALRTWAAGAGIPKEKILIIENGLDLRRFQGRERVDARSLIGCPEDVPLGIVVCGIRPEKGIDLLLSALSRQSSPFCVLIVGPDADPEYAAACRHQVTNLGLAGRILFTGPRTDVPALLRGCDFALMPSRSESGPLVLIEYLLAGLPFVSTLAGGIAEGLAKSGLAGFVPPGDEEAFANALAELISLPRDRLRHRGRMGPFIAAAGYGLEHRMDAWNQAYQTAGRGIATKRETSAR